MFWGFSINILKTSHPIQLTQVNRFYKGSVLSHPNQQSSESLLQGLVSNRPIRRSNHQTDRFSREPVNMVCPISLEPFNIVLTKILTLGLLVTSIRKNKLLACLWFDKEKQASCMLGAWRIGLKIPMIGPLGYATKLSKCLNKIKYINYWFFFFKFLPFKFI